MKKASKILFQIGGILSLVNIFNFLSGAVALIVCAVLLTPGHFEELINNGMLSVGTLTDPVLLSTLVVTVCIIMAVAYFITAICCVLNAVFSFKARKEEDKKLYVLNIVFGALSGNPLNIVGAILSIISQKEETKE